MQFTDAIENAPPGCNGLLVQRRIHFMGRRIRFGGVEPSWQLRLWKNGRGECEQRWMDEHMIVDGGIAKSGLVISDINLNSLGWWTEKHNDYASREAVEVVLSGVRPPGNAAPQNRQMGAQARLRRWLKQRIYQRLPGGVRAALYFMYRYVLRLGFLDGAAGFYFHALQGFWYRLLVDAKLANIARRRTEGMEALEAVRAETGIDLSGENVSTRG